MPVFLLERGLHVTGLLEYRACGINVFTWLDGIEADTRNIDRLHPWGVLCFGTSILHVYDYRRGYIKRKLVALIFRSLLLFLVSAQRRKVSHLCRVVLACGCSALSSLLGRYLWQIELCCLYLRRWNVVGSGLSVIGVRLSRGRELGNVLVCATTHVIVV